MLFGFAGGGSRIAPTKEESEAGATPSTTTTRRRSIVDALPLDLVVVVLKFAFFSVADLSACAATDSLLRSCAAELAEDGNNALWKVSLTDVGHHI